MRIYILTMISRSFLTEFYFRMGLFQAHIMRAQAYAHQRNNNIT